MSYSVGVQNIFELLEDETDDQPEVKTLQTKLEENKTSKPTGPKQPPVGGKPVKGSGAQRDKQAKGADAEAAANKAEGFTEVSTQKNRSPATRRDDRPRREGDRKPREGGDRKPREPREGGDRKPREGGDRRPREAREGGDRNPREPREGRAPREDRGPRDDRPGREGKEERVPREDRDKEKWTREHQNAPYDGKKRTYDRKSGTGRNPKENKKGGAGAGNWGSDTNPEEELAAVEQEKAEVKADTEAAAAEDATETTEAATPAEPKEPEKKEISFADFKKQREATLSALPTLPAPRQAGEGVNDKEKDKWATEALNKPASQSATTTTTQEKTAAAKKNTVSLDQFFTIKPREQPREDRRRENRDRDGGDRKPREGGDRRGPKQGGKGKPEGAKKQTQGTAPPKDADFPTLNTKA